MNDITYIPYLVSLAGALVHSLWIFAAWVSLAFLVNRFLSNAAIRYRIYLLCLLTLPLWFGVLLWIHAPSASVLGAQDFPVASEAVPIAPAASADPITSGPHWFPYLGLVYLTGLLLIVLRSGMDYHRGRLLRRSGLPLPPEARGRFDRLRARFGGRFWVRGLVSTRVNTVMVVGFLRPVILFPVALLNQLSVAEAEAILLHEFVHLKRNDHRWLVVQRFIRDLFFYHPLVYWLSRQIDLEREHACDDAVVGRYGVRRPVYVQALLRVASYAESLNNKIPTTMSVRATASLFGLRLRRLMQSPPVSNGGLRFPYLLILLLVGGSLVLGHAQSADRHTPPPLEETLAENGRISGRVLGSSTLTPLIGASVLAVVEGETFGTVTDIDGRYILSLPVGEREVSFTYVGFVTSRRTTIVEEKTAMDVILEKDGQSGDSSDAQSGTTIRVTGDQTPLKDQKILYIADGKRLTGDDPMQKINPGDIESINVIKEEAKIAALGHGSDFDGAILITMKKE